MMIRIVGPERLVTKRAEERLLHARPHCAAGGVLGFRCIACCARSLVLRPLGLRSLEEETQSILTLFDATNSTGYEH